MAWESRLSFFFRWYILVKFCFFILVYRDEDKSHLFFIFSFFDGNSFIKKKVYTFVFVKQK